MPVEIVDSWPAQRPMRDAKRNGTRMLIAFQPREPGFAPIIRIARWVVPVETPGKPLGRDKRQAFERGGGYWSTSANTSEGERPMKLKALAWWPLPEYQEDEA